MSHSSQPHINDDSNPEHAFSNCALTTVAAAMGTTATEVRSDLYRRIGRQPNLDPKKNDDTKNAFAHYCSSLTFEKLTSENMNRLQIEGVKRFLAINGRAVFQAGSEAWPLQLGVAKDWMQAFAAGTEFCVMIGDTIRSGKERHPVSGHTPPASFKQAHWVYATRTAQGLTFRDYQMDMAPNPAIEIALQAKMHDRSFRQPTEAPITPDPLNAWGSPLDNQDRLVVLALPGPHRRR